MAIKKEPFDLDVASYRNISRQPLFFNLYHSLVRYESDTKWSYQDAENCNWPTKLKLVCQLKKDRKWSNGQPIVAEDYVRSYNHHLKNNWRGKNEFARLKTVVAANKHQLEFIFKEPDPEFLWRLAGFNFPPLPANKTPSINQATSLVVNGDYKIRSWEPGKKVVLEDNPFTAGQRPQIEILFVPGAQGQMQLWDKKQIDFVSMVPTAYYRKYQKNLKYAPLHRFDYFGISQNSLLTLEQRQALARSLDYSGLARLYQARGRPGCPGIPRDWLTADLCIEFKPGKKLKGLRPIEFAVNQSAGLDMLRTVEWIDAQLRTHLGVRLKIKNLEGKVLSQRLQSRPPAMFRRGVSLTRPTCAAALETFLSNSPTNYVGFANPEFDKIVTNLSQAVNKELCTKGIRLLLASGRVIPTGQIHFAYLVSKKYQGVNYNSLYQIDLSQLKPVSK